MTDRDDESIARQEADETFRSITDLDSIADTMFVAITFLLAALATWTSFAFGRLSGSVYLEGIYIVLVIVCALLIAGSVFFLSISLAPRGFYGENIGERFLDHSWLLWRNDDAVGYREFADRRGDIAEEADLRNEYEQWLDQYDPDTTLSSRESFEFSRLLNYKTVARAKARHTAYGIALLRIAVILLVLLILVTLLGPLAV